MRTLVRRINEWDAPTMLKIYKPYVEDSNATAETVLPTIAEYTGTGGALAEYSAILSAVMLMAIVGILMVAVRLITNKA